MPSPTFTSKSLKLINDKYAPFDHNDFSEDPVKIIQVVTEPVADVTQDSGSDTTKEGE